MIQKALALFLLLQLQIFGANYNSTVIELEAKLFPKMILLSEDIDKNSPSLIIYILTQEEDLDYANEFKEAIQTNYPDKLMGKTLHVFVKQFDSEQKRPDAMIILYHPNEELEKIALWANNKRIITLAYDPSYMNLGILASIYLGVSTKPYLNSEIMKTYNFNFNPYLLELSKFK